MYNSKSTSSPPPCRPGILSNANWNKMDFQLAWRNIWRNPRRTLIIMTAVVIGVFAMIFLTALMRGMMVDMIENGISTLTGDVKIYASGYRDDPSIDHRITDPQQIMKSASRVLPDTARMTDRVRVSAIAANARHSFGVFLTGIDPAAEKGVSFIGQAPIRGQMAASEKENWIVIGAALADKFETRIGHKLILMSEGVNHEIASKAFRITGIYRAELKSTEEQYVFAGKAAVQEMLGMGSSVSAIAIALNRHDQADAVAQRVKTAVHKADLSVYTWQELLPMLRASLSMFDGFVILWYLMVFVAMAFGIVNTLLMAVFERMREFGLMKALGMTPGRIIRSVLMESIMILSIGLLAGNLLSAAMIWIVSQTGIDLSAFAAGLEYAGMTPVIRPDVYVRDVFIANGVVLLLGLLVSAYPAAKAARITPVAAMARV